MRRRDRAAAVLALEIAANYWWAPCAARATAWSSTRSGAELVAPFGGEADDAADAAIDAVLDAIRPSIPATWDVCSSWLEAAALLRDGWSPGDPVHRLNPKGS